MPVFKAQSVQLGRYCRDALETFPGGAPKNCECHEQSSLKFQFTKFFQRVELVESQICHGDFSKC